MKTMSLLVATLLLMSFVSCQSNQNDLLEKKSSISELITTYGARVISVDETEIAQFSGSGVRAITIDEANKMLADIRNHEGSQKNNSLTKVPTKGDGHFQILMSESVANLVKFNIQLNLVELSSGALYYNSYKADCESNSCAWYVSGFSFSNDNNSVGCYKFQSKTYLNLMIVDGDVKYIQVPMMVNGIFDPATQSADFTYSL